MIGLTPSQTIGPYFSIGLTWADGQRLIAADTPGMHIELGGCVYDGSGDAVADALLEIWQADAAGSYTAHPAGFCGSGRCAVDAEGRYRFETVKPGRVRGCGDRSQAPHINLVVFARGLLRQLYTRIYFADEGVANAADEVLACVPAARRYTLLARREGRRYAFDVRLQGEHETVFFDL